MQVFEQFRRALRRGRQIADDQHGPLVAHQLERSSYRTSIYLTSSQFFAFNNSSARLAAAQSPKEHHTLSLSLWERARVSYVPLSVERTPIPAAGGMPYDSARM